MKSAVGIFILLLIVAGVGFGLYNFYNGKDFELYEQAKELDAQGDFYAAYDKVLEAVGINPKNLKVQSYKAELFLRIQDDKAMKKAEKGHFEAVRAMDRTDYSYAATKIDEARASLDKISGKNKDEVKVAAIEKLLEEDMNRLNSEASEKYYNQARSYYNGGEYEKAFNTIDYINNPNKKIKDLKYEIIMALGNKNYDSVISSPRPNAFKVNDGIYWFEKIDEDSPYYDEARVKISKLKGLEKR